MEGITNISKKNTTVSLGILICGLLLSFAWLIPQAEGKSVRHRRHHTENHRIKCESHKTSNTAIDYSHMTAGDLGDNQKTELLRQKEVEKLIIFSRLDFEYNDSRLGELRLINATEDARDTANSEVSSDINESSLCPWETVQEGDYDENRFPHHLPKIRCLCKKCFTDGLNEGNQDQTLGCKPVYDYKFALFKKKSASLPEDGCWELGKVGVPVGCTCATVANRKTEN